jgi:hypothetical protein
MSKPASDHSDVDTGSNELNADTMAPRVWSDAFCCKRRRLPPGCLNVLLELEANTCRTEWLTVSVDEDRFPMGALKAAEATSVTESSRFAPTK